MPANATVSSKAACKRRIDRPKGQCAHGCRGSTPPHALAQHLRKHFKHCLSTAHAAHRPPAAPGWLRRPAALGVRRFRRCSCVCVLSSCLVPTWPPLVAILRSLLAVPRSLLAVPRSRKNSSWFVVREEGRARGYAYNI